MQPISFNDLSNEWSGMKTEAMQRISQVFDHGKFVSGPEVEQLESELSKANQYQFAVTCSSGTTALLMALMALELNPGDEVIVPDYTFIAPIECILLLGLKPILADVSVPSGLINSESVNSLITKRTKAIICVSLYGQPIELSPLNKLAKTHGVALIEDAAQSFGSRHHINSINDLPLFSCTSFFPTKTLGGAGDGGAVFTNSKRHAERLLEIRNHGQQGKYNHTKVGINGRMSSISAAVLLTKLNYFDELILKRREIAKHYNSFFLKASESNWLQFSHDAQSNNSVFSLYVLLVDRREHIVKSLREAGIETAIHYGAPVHTQVLMQNCNNYATNQGSVIMANKAMCLPNHPSLSLDQVTYIATQLLNCLSQGKAT